MSTTDTNRTCARGDRCLTLRALDRQSLAIDDETELCDQCLPERYDIDRDEVDNAVSRILRAVARCSHAAEIYASANRERAETTPTMRSPQRVDMTANLPVLHLGGAL